MKHGLERKSGARSVRTTGAAPPESAASGRGLTPALAHLEADLAGLEAEGLLRHPRPGSWSPARSFCSNDYLGLASRLPSRSGAAGAGASRLVSGNCVEHEAVEGAVAEWLGAEAALLFTSGYAANVGALSALAQRGDLVVSDALNHASLIDGARLSRARVEVVPHLDLDAMARALRRRTEKRAWVVSESYFSMDADGPDLARLRSLCDETRAGLILDEAHAIGALGPSGRGLAAEAGIAPDVLVGTFGKALGGGGAFVAGPAALRLWLWNRARSFVFSTGLSPATAGANLEAVARVRAADHARRTLAERATQLRDGLVGRGVRVLGFGHIVPWVVGEPAAANALATALQGRGFQVQAIRPPSVPVGTARLRLTVHAGHTEADVSTLLTTLDEVLACAP